MRIYKMNIYCFALIFYQILSTHSLRKYIKISLENLYVDIMGLKGLSCNVDVIRKVVLVNIMRHSIENLWELVLHFFFCQLITEEL